jgi:hypothetical protein
MVGWIVCGAVSAVFGLTFALQRFRIQGLENIIDELMFRNARLEKERRENRLGWEEREFFGPKRPS